MYYGPSSQKLFNAALKVKDLEKFLSSLTHDELIYLKYKVKVKAQGNKDKEDQTKAKVLRLSILTWQKKHTPIDIHLQYNQPKPQFFYYPEQKKGLSEVKQKTEAREGKDQKAISMQEEFKKVQFQDKKYLQNFFQSLSEEKKRQLFDITCEWNQSQLSIRQKKEKDTQDCSLKEKMNEREDNSGFQMLEFEQAPLLHHCSQDESDQIK